MTKLSDAAELFIEAEEAYMRDLVQPVVDRIAVAMHKSLVEQDVHGYLASKIDAGILARVAVDVITGRHTRPHTGDTPQDTQQNQED